jgi:hypothetical protein
VSTLHQYGCPGRASGARLTVELTGLEMMQMNALGQYSAAASAKDLTIPALMAKRSSLVIPGCTRRVSGALNVRWGRKAPFGGHLRDTASVGITIHCELGSSLPAGMTTMWAPVRASLRPSSSLVCPIPSLVPSAPTQSVRTRLTHQ